MTPGDGTRASVEAAIGALRERYGDLTVVRGRVENDPASFADGQALAEEACLAGAGAWVVDDGRVLFIRHADAPEQWGLPGGGLEPGETLAEAAVREVREETGVGARVTDCWLARRRTIVDREAPDRQLQMLDVWFEAVAEEPVVALDPSAWEDDEEITEARWFDYAPRTVHELFADRVAAWAGD